LSEKRKPRPEIKTKLKRQPKQSNSAAISSITKKPKTYREYQINRESGSSVDIAENSIGQRDGKRRGGKKTERKNWNPAAAVSSYNIHVWHRQNRFSIEKLPKRINTKGINGHTSPKTIIKSIKLNV